MLWYHYAIGFYWAVSSFWLFLDASDQPGYSNTDAFFVGLVFGWLVLPVVLVGRALR